ncbi:hypothetical protein MWH25_04760 [Natroniella acetigena]|uniref:hypothetical protein n=1 Tax=Natroniella acetigena TaxID=52004 RepID=UPI00200A6DA1|nr:hypothetical protein [Natroniella acetigena]MCK8827057.1 hypothetical protein [Natroniella acetigena]
MLNKEDKRLVKEFSQIIEGVSTTVIDRSLKKVIRESAEEFKGEVVSLSDKVEGRFKDINTEIDSRLNSNDKTLKKIQEEVSIVDRLLKELIEKKSGQFMRKLSLLSDKVDNEVDGLNNRIVNRLDKSGRIVDKLEEEGSKLEEMFRGTEVLVETMKELESTSRLLSLLENMESSVENISDSNQKFIETIKVGKAELQEQREDLQEAISLYKSQSDKLIEQYDYFREAHNKIIGELASEAIKIQEKWDADLEDLLSNIEEVYKNLLSFNKKLGKSIDTIDVRFEVLNKRVDKKLESNIKVFEDSLDSLKEELKIYISDKLEEESKIIKSHSEDIISQVEKSHKKTYDYMAKSRFIFISMNLVFFSIIIYLLFI